MYKTIKPKTKRMMKARVKGQSLPEIAIKEYPNTKLSTSVPAVSKQLNKPEVIEAMQDLKLKALEDNGITWDSNVKVYKEAQEATKAIVMGKGSKESFIDIVPDYSVRVRATDSLVKLMPQSQGNKVEANDLNPELLKAIQKGNILELQRILFESHTSDQLKE